MTLKNYETVFILTPILSEQQMKDTVQKFREVLEKGGAEIVNEEQWGLRKLAYPIAHKSTGFYAMLEFRAPASLINTLEVEYRRDERVLRFLTTALDKFAVEYNIKRKSGKFNKKPAETAA
jgi:small subunit ribosomal protein S6